MKGVLVLAHGSRAAETEETLSAVVDMVREMLPGTITEIGYMEFGRVTIEVGLDNLRAKGVDEIFVIPYFLFEGIHIKEDIPKEIEAYREKRPGAKITMGKTLGADRRLAEILRDRIEGCVS